MAVLEAKDLTYYYFSDRKVFEHLDLEFERGKVYVILGASGSGKTTLLSLLGGLDTPKGGMVQFDGRDITEIGLEKYRRVHIQVPVQGPHGRHRRAAPAPGLDRPGGQQAPVR